MHGLQIPAVTLTNRRGLTLLTGFIHLEQEHSLSHQEVSLLCHLRVEGETGKGNGQRQPPQEKNCSSLPWSQ